MKLFEQWEGKLYNSEGLLGRRVLILGESHYGTPEEETPAFTRDCVEFMAKGERGHRFFTVVAKLLLGAPTGKPLSQPQRRDFWDRVSFYNYIQAFPSHRSRVRPTTEMWSTAADCFPSVLRELRPSFVLVLGRELSARIPAVPPHINVCSVPHPSSFGFKQTEWGPHVQSSLLASSVGDT